MDDNFGSARALITRAHENAQEFQKRADTFFETHLPTRFARFDEERGDFQHGISGVAAVDPAVSVVAFDAVNNLRSALDHAVYGSAEAMGFSSPNGTKFPFGDTREKAQADAKRCHPNVEMCAFLVEELHPYIGGTNLLWGLNRIRNIKNHRKLIVPSFSISQISIANGVFTSGMTPTTEWNDDRTEYVFMRTGDGQKFYDLTISPKLTFSEVPTLSEEPVQRIFGMLLREVTDIVDRIEAKTSEIIATYGSLPPSST